MKHPKWEHDLVERIADRFAQVFIEEIEKAGGKATKPKAAKAEPKNVKPIGFDLSKSAQAAKKLAKVDPQEICKQYREAVRAVYGDTIANTSQVYYDRGWYYINVARRFEDGSVGIGGVLPAACRLKEVLKNLAELNRRARRKV